MKNFSLINGVHFASLFLIALAVIGALSFKVSGPKNPSVLSSTTSNINMYVISENKTISEKPFDEKGFPSFDGGAATFRIDITPPAPAGTTVTMTTSEECVLFSDGQNGNIFNQTKKDSINALYLLQVGAVDDAEYEGEHSCKVTAVFSSSSTVINGQQRSITFKIIDNDPKPENEIENNDSAEIKNKLNVISTKLLDESGKEVGTNNTKAKFNEGEKITISGTTVADGEVKLYIFSEPQEASVVADDEGAWSYTIEEIEPGDHRVEVEVTDPLTGETSERAQLLAFEVAQKPQSLAVRPTETELQTEPDDESSVGLYIAVGTSVLLLVIGIISLIIYKKKHPHYENDYSSETINPSDGMGSEL